MSDFNFDDCEDPALMLTKLAVPLTDRKSRLICVAFCRRVWHLLVDERSRNAVLVAERFADGTVTEDELFNANQDAWEFASNTVFEDASFEKLTDFELNAADLPAWASEEDADALRAAVSGQRALGVGEAQKQAQLIRCICGNSFGTASVDAPSPTPNIVALARKIYESSEFELLPQLGDEIEAAGCTNDDILRHCREPQYHARGCWVVDLLLEQR